MRLFRRRRNTLREAIAKSASSVEALGIRLKAGTNCGSCIPEMRRLLADKLKTASTASITPTQALARRARCRSERSSNKPVIDSVKAPSSLLTACQFVPASKLKRMFSCEISLACDLHDSLTGHNNGNERGKSNGQDDLPAVSPGTGRA